MKGEILGCGELTIMIWRVGGEKVGRQTMSSEKGEGRKEEREKGKRKKKGGFIWFSHTFRVFFAVTAF